MPFTASPPIIRLYFRFNQSSLAGSYFLGKCIVDYSVLYKSDIRGDELKSQGDTHRYRDLDIPLHDDEVIHIKDSFLLKTLVHSFSHDPENLEEFLIQNTVALNYANIHGSTVEGCFLGPFSSVDLTTLHDCVIGTFAYVQVGELSHQLVEAGKIWIQNGDLFDFQYTLPEEVLKKYIDFQPGQVPKGIFMDFIERCKPDFQRVFDDVHVKPPVKVPKGAALNPFAVVKGQTSIRRNVLVAQRAYLENAYLGRGANAQENCYIIEFPSGRKRRDRPWRENHPCRSGQQGLCGFQRLFARPKRESLKNRGRLYCHAPHHHRSGRTPGNPGRSSDLGIHKESPGFKRTQSAPG